MTAFFDLAGEYFRFWPYALAGAVGIILALMDRKVFGRYIFAALLVVLAAGGQLAMYFSPFTLQGGGDYMRGLIVSLMALAGLAGYALAIAGYYAFQKMTPEGAR
jgi:hypothetical protein